MRRMKLVLLQYFFNIAMNGNEVMTQVSTLDNIHTIARLAVNLGHNTGTPHLDTTLGHHTGTAHRDTTLKPLSSKYEHENAIKINSLFSTMPEFFLLLVSSHSS